MKRKILSIICMALILSMTLVSCGDGASSSEGSKESVLSQDGSSSESSLTSEDESSEDEKPFYLKTYEAVERENWTDLCLFTPDSFKSLEVVEPESFTYETLCDIVNDTIELYEKYDYITVQFEEGCSYSCRYRGGHITVFLTYPDGSQGEYQFMARDYVDKERYALRICEEKQIVFKTGKTKEEMLFIDKLVLREIIFLRLLYVINSDSINWHGGFLGNDVYMYLRNGLDKEDMLQDAKIPHIEYSGEQFTYVNYHDNQEKTKELLPEWLQRQNDKNTPGYTGDAIYEE